MLARLSTGMTYKAISEELGIDPSSVREALHVAAKRADSDLFRKGCRDKIRRTIDGPKRHRMPPPKRWFIDNARLFLQAIQDKEEREADKAIEPDLISKYVRYLNRRGYTVLDPQGHTIRPGDPT